MINWTPSTGARMNHEVSKPYLFSEESEFSWRDLGSNVIVLSKYWMTVILKRQWNWSHPLKFTELELMSESLREINLETKSVSTALHSVLYKLVFIERTVPLNSSLSLHQDANSAASPAPTVWKAQEWHHDNCSSKGCLQFVKPCTFSSGVPVSNSHKGTLCQGHTQILPWDPTNNGRAAWNAMSSWKSLTAWRIILSKILYNGFLNQTEADPWRSIQL